MKSLDQWKPHHICPRLMFETHRVKDLKPHRLVGGHDVAWLESLQKNSEQSPRNKTTSKTSQKVGTILRRWQHRQTAAMYTEIEARRTFATLNKQDDLSISQHWYWYGEIILWVIDTEVKPHALALQSQKDEQALVSFSAGRRDVA